VGKDDARDGRADPLTDLPGPAHPPDPYPAAPTPAHPSPVDSPSGGVAPVSAAGADGADLVQQYERACNELAATTCILGCLVAVGGMILLFGEPPGSLSQGQGRALALLALAVALAWLTGARFLWQKKAWAAVLVGGIATLNILGGFIAAVNQGGKPSWVGILINFGVAFQAQRLMQLKEQLRWRVAGNAGLQDLVARRDVGGILHLLRHGSKDDKPAAARALGCLGAAAAPAVGELCGLVERAAPPPPDQTDVCELCKVKLTVWNRALGRQMCSRCASQLGGADNLTAPPLALVAAEALGRIGPPARVAIPALRSVARSKDPRLRAAAEEAVRQLEEVRP
jgi:hypothetical protein